MPNAKKLMFLSLTAVILIASASASASASGAWLMEDRLAEPVSRFDPEPFDSPVTTGDHRSVDVDTWNRSSVVNLYYNEFVPPFSVAMQWTGYTASCTAGNTSQAYLDATFQVLNFFRSMVGLDDVSIATEHTTACQEAALIMSANGALHHDPPDTWACWTSSGRDAAGASNLALGNAGPNAVVAYIRDSGLGNHFVGHRRWLLFPRRNRFGSGSVGETTASANAFYVFTSYVSRPASPDKIAWPPEGHIPYQVVYPRWSLSLNTSDSVSFGAASVTMTEGTTPVALSVVSTSDNGFGDNTIVWEPSGLAFIPGAPDRRFTVTVSNIMVNGAPHSEIYDVVVIDPAVVTDHVFSDGFESGDTTNWSFPDN